MEWREKKLEVEKLRRKERKMFFFYVVACVKERKLVYFLLFGIGGKSKGIKKILRQIYCFSLCLSLSLLFFALKNYKIILVNSKPSNLFICFFPNLGGEIFCVVTT